MLIGYARVSTQDQNLELQIEALTGAGCQKVFEDKISGSRAERPGLAKTQESLREGDTLVVWKLDRLGRSVESLVNLVGELHKQGVQFRSLTDAIDTGTASGRFFFHFMASLAEMERELTVERTRAGLKIARQLGRKGGRKRQMTESKIGSANNLLASGVPPKCSQQSRNFRPHALQVDSSRQESEPGFESDAGRRKEALTPMHQKLRRTVQPLQICLLICNLLLTGCSPSKVHHEAAEAPPPDPVVVAGGINDAVHVDDPQRFPLVVAATRQSVSTLNVTGSVQPDPSREIPIVPLANGRVVALHVGLGDTVHKGQLIMDVQSTDVSQAFGSYLKAVADEHLTAVVLNRDKLLYDKGAIAQSQLEIAQNGEDDARADLTASAQQLRILGVDKNHPGDLLHVRSPINGVIVSQNTAAAGVVGITYAGAAGSFLIADLTHVWVVCDVYENDLATVHLGEQAQIRLNAFPDKVRTGTISDIGAVLDPTLRTAKVRIQVPNPDNTLRIGLFATATFRGARPEQRVALPANAVLHLHDREFVFEPTNTAGDFRRTEVKAGSVLDGNDVEILSGLSSGQQVVANALELQNTAAQ